MELLHAPTARALFAAGTNAHHTLVHRSRRRRRRDVLHLTRATRAGVILM